MTQFIPTTVYLQSLKRFRTAEAANKLSQLLADIIEPVVIEHEGQPAVVLMSFRDVVSLNDFATFLEAVLASWGEEPKVHRTSHDLTYPRLRTTEAKEQLADLVAHPSGTIIIEHKGKPAAALMPYRPFAQIYELMVKLNTSMAERQQQREREDAEQAAAPPPRQRG
jgi:PHD/YefM family antitoxin component YafN of YafNO toxin-antitoxin module